MDSYGRLRARRALDETRRIWSSHETLAFFSPGLVGLAVATALRVFWPKLQDLNKLSTAAFALALIVVGYVFAWLCSYVINYIWGSPASLHEEQRLLISKLETKAAVPALSPQEQANRRTAADAVQGATKAELACLKHILNQQEIETVLLFRAFTGQVRDIEDALKKWEHVLLQRRIEHGTNRTFWCVIPGFKEALSHVLYESA